VHGLTIGPRRAYFQSGARLAGAEHLRDSAKRDTVAAQLLVD
jgi:hypothetical protein